MKTLGTFLFALFFSMTSLIAADVWVEAENFTQKGGWVLDQQFSDLMGSDYLMAHGLGSVVEDAKTNVVFPKNGIYHLYVRTYNWTSPWSNDLGAGRFLVAINNQSFKHELGGKGNSWEWQYAGQMSINKGENTLSLKDLTGFNGRCDALYFTEDKEGIPPSELPLLTSFREKKNKTQNIANGGKFDLVVCGAGVAGMCAAVSAARLGLKVALINDRPVLGGNNSSEIRVHLGGRIELAPYTELGNLIKEFGPAKQGNAQPANYYEDEKKQAWISKEKNITLFPNMRIFDVQMNGNKIVSVIARHIETGKKVRYSAPLFTDCTGDGTVGFLAGADWRMGREAYHEFKESTAPVVADLMTMGASVQWYSTDKKQKTDFPVFKYGLDFNQANSEKVTMGEWTWETGMNRDQIKDFEYIRDYGMMVIFSNWSYLKNEMPNNEKFQSRSLEWVAYVAGKRESRRLLGDLILTENDLKNYVEYPDASGCTSWTIDLHYPDPKNTTHFPGNEFKSIAKHIPIYPYPVPYRCLYSRNIENLFMAGRNISVTHVALGTTRVMRTTGILGEVVGMAAKVCKDHKCSPRDVYQNYLDQLIGYMKEGTGVKGLKNKQTYNQGQTLSKKPQKK